MTLDVHHPSPADVDPLGEGLSARRCRQRGSERDESQQFHDDVFHGCSPSIYLLDVSATSTNHTQSFSIGRGAETLMQINCESRRGLKVRWQFRYPLWVNSRLQALIKLCPPYFLKADIATSPRHVCFVPLATE